MGKGMVVNLEQRKMSKYCEWFSVNFEFTTGLVRSSNRTILIDSIVCPLQLQEMITLYVLYPAVTLIIKR